MTTIDMVCGVYLAFGSSFGMSSWLPVALPSSASLPKAGDRRGTSHTPPAPAPLSIAA